MLILQIFIIIYLETDIEDKPLHWIIVFLFHKVSSWESLSNISNKVNINVINNDFNK